MIKRRSISVMKENEKKKRRNTVDLPEDLVVEIISRLPEASVTRFRSTSKGWNDLIKNDRKLAKKSLVLMLIDFRVYLVSVDINGIHENIVKISSQFSLKDPLSNSSKEVDIDKVFHCDGLLLCTTEDNRLVVWNPCSGETMWIINPKKFSANSPMKFGFYVLGKSSCNKYKILRVDQHGHGRKPCLVEYEIYDFTSSSWRRVGETRNWSITWLKKRGISVNGDTYWLAYSFSKDLPRGDFLLRFDFSTERFESVSLPVDHIFYNPLALSVTREEQKLCLLALRNCNLSVRDIDVWIATNIESTGSMSWSKFLTVVEPYLHQFLTLEQAIYKQLFIFCTGMNFLADRENKVLVCPGSKHGNSNKFLHIVGEDDKYVQVDHHDAGSKCSLLLSYVPTLVQIQQGSLGVGASKASIT